MGEANKNDFFLGDSNFNIWHNDNDDDLKG